MVEEEAAQAAKLAKLESEDASEDNELVEQAVKHIQKALAATVFKGLVEVGDYLFKHFFDSDIERVRSHNPQKNASFRALVEKCGTELPVSKSWLNSAVGVAIMCKALPGDTSYRQLPPSHQTVLLPLREPERVEALAEKAVKNDFTVMRLREAVQKDLAKNKDESRRRPKQSAIVKTLDRSLKLFAIKDGRKSFTKAQVNELNEEDAKHAREIAEQLMERLKKLVQQLKKK